MADNNIIDGTSRLIVKNLPKNVTEKDLRKTFKKHELTDVKLVHKPNGTFRGFAFLGLPDNLNAINLRNMFNQTYIGTSKITIEFALPVGQKAQALTSIKAKIKETKPINNDKKISNNIFEIDKEDMEEFEGFLKLNNIDPKRSRVTYVDKKAKTSSNEVAPLPIIIKKDAEENGGDIVDSARLFVRNIPFDCVEENLLDLFKQFGGIEQVHMPRDPSNGCSKGFAFVTFLSPCDAVEALNKLDGHSYHGRVLHILPAKAPPESLPPDELISFKNKKSAIKRDGAHIEWNTLFLGSKATANILCQKLDISKDDLLKSDMYSITPAVRLAIGETDIVSETKEFLTRNGVCLDAFNKCNTVKSKETLLAKNLPAETTRKELCEFIQSKLHESDDTFFPPNIILPPHGISAIIGFNNPNDAKRAFKCLYFAKFKHVPFYLEWAPLNSLDKSTPITINNPSLIPQPSTSVVYIKNLNFTTTEISIQEKFKSVGEIIKVTIAKTVSKESKASKSLGYGFIEFSTPETAKEAVKTLQNTVLDGHRLLLKLSSGSKKKILSSLSDKLSSKSEQEERVVLLVKNIPFEAEHKEIAQLFSVYGRLKRVHLPTKLQENNRKHRGFAFVEFLTTGDALNAYESLRFSTHLYGRRLVLEWAENATSLDILRKRAATSTLDLKPFKQKKAVMQTSNGDENID